MKILVFAFAVALPTANVLGQHHQIDEHDRGNGNDIRMHNQPAPDGYLHNRNASTDRVDSNAAGVGSGEPVLRPEPPALVEESAANTEFNASSSSIPANRVQRVDIGNRVTSTPVPGQPTLSGVYLRQIFVQKGRAVVEITDGLPIHIGSDLIMTSYDGQQCELRILGADTSFATIDISTCALQRQMRAGQKLERSLLPARVSSAEGSIPVGDREQVNPSSIGLLNEEGTLTPRDQISRRWKFGIGFGLATEGELKFDDSHVTTSSGSGSVEAEFKIRDEWVFTVEIRSTPKYSFGFSGGLNYGVARKFKSVKFTGAGGSSSVSFADDNSKIHSGVAYVSAVYRWDHIYIPFGINYSAIDIKMSDTYLGYNVNGGLGGQIGVGAMLNEYVSIEFLIQATQVELDMTDETNSIHIDFGSGYLTDYIFGTKFYF